ncbi:MAG TPA: M18 family aminopeptidase [Brevibacterium ravenspurgense]|nr:M18 family aminopeptidase [Brevibacterium ravenspurgense]
MSTAAEKKAAKNSSAQAAAQLTSASLTSAQKTALELGEYAAASPSSYHAADEASRRLQAAGYELLDEAQTWNLAPGGRYVLVREGAVAAFALPADVSADVSAGSLRYRVFGAHTDSPGFKLKPGGAHTAAGFTQVGVEVYGGVLLNSWLDRELCFAGRLALRDGTTVLARTPGIARIPQLAIHLDRQVNEGLKLDRQQHTVPVVGLEVCGGDVLALLAEAADVSADQVVGHDVITAPVQEAALFGASQELLACSRMDNLSSTFAGLRAMEELDTKNLTAVSVFISNDHEEVGSETRTGASGPMLADILERVSISVGADREEHLRAIAGSICISADAGHAVHPNYPERHDPQVRPTLGEGLLLKLNAVQRYATDAAGTAEWARLCDAAGVQYQPFVSNNAMPCGSTIGPLTATRLGMTVVDAGIPLLSMHSAREMAAVNDIEALVKVAAAHLG